MGQEFPLDRGLRRIYYPLVAIGLSWAAAACAHYESIAPENLGPLPPATAASWVREFTPARSMRISLRWRFENQKGKSGGRAVVRVAPPDTLRFDYRGPFGRSGSAVVVGGGALWARPAQDFENLIPIAPLFWAALGIATAAPDGAQVLGLDGPERRAWRYVVGGEELDFVHIRGPEERLLAQLRYRGRILGVSEVLFEGKSRNPVRATMVFPPDASRFSFTIEAIDTVAAFDPETWQQT